MISHASTLEIYSKKTVDRGTTTWKEMLVSETSHLCPFMSPLILTICRCNGLENCDPFKALADVKPLSRFPNDLWKRKIHGVDCYSARELEKFIQSICKAPLWVFCKLPAQFERGKKRKTSNANVSWFAHQIGQSLACGWSKMDNWQIPVRQPGARLTRVEIILNRFPVRAGYPNAAWIAVEVFVVSA